MKNLFIEEATFIEDVEKFAGKVATKISKDISDALSFEKQSPSKNASCSAEKVSAESHSDPPQITARYKLTFSSDDPEMHIPFMLDLSLRSAKHIDRALLDLSEWACSLKKRLEQIKDRYSEDDFIGLNATIENFLIEFGELEYDVWHAEDESEFEQEVKGLRSGLAKLSVELYS